VKTIHALEISEINNDCGLSDYRGGEARRAFTTFSSSVFKMEMGSGTLSTCFMPQVSVGSALCPSADLRLGPPGFHKSRLAKLRPPPQRPNWRDAGGSLPQLLLACGNQWMTLGVNTRIRDTTSREEDAAVTCHDCTDL
jgi:hypothetical protein